ncbi:hypothetical protein FHG87_024150, partial [Trinorchestia longiramus]
CFHQETSKLVEASYELSLLIAKVKRPHSVGETLVKPSLLSAANTVLGEESQRKLSKISLSDNTVKRRIDELSEDIKEQVWDKIKASRFYAIQCNESTDIAHLCQLLVYSRFVDEGTVKKEILFSAASETIAKAIDAGGTDTYTRTSGRAEKQVPPEKVAAQKTVLFSNPARRPHDGIDNDKSGKVLGLHLSSQGYTSHITQRKAIAQNNLSRLYRFKHMHPDTKRKLYLAYVRSALIYPAIPLHTLSPSSISKLQSVQNKATRSITNAEWHDFDTSAQLHRQTKLTPINTLLHEHAKKIWTNIEQMHPQLYLHLTFPQETRQIPHRAFPSSKTKILGPPPTPKYT